MIVCYDDYAYSYFTFIFALCLFAPIAFAMLLGLIVTIWEKFHHD